MAVQLCEECFPDWGNYEVRTWTQFIPCDVCGRFDDRLNGGLRVNLFQSDPREKAKQLQAIVDAAVLAEREACARMLELRDSELLLMAGEMTAQELRTVKAVLAQRARVIRERSNLRGEGLADGAAGRQSSAEGATSTVVLERKEAK